MTVCERYVLFLEINNFLTFECRMLGLCSSETYFEITNFDDLNLLSIYQFEKKSVGNLV